MSYLLPHMLVQCSQSGLDLFHSFLNRELGHFCVPYTRHFATHADRPQEDLIHDREKVFVHSDGGRVRRVGSRLFQVVILGILVFFLFFLVVSLQFTRS